MRAWQRSLPRVPLSSSLVLVLVLALACEPRGEDAGDASIIDAGCVPEVDLDEANLMLELAPVELLPGGQWDFDVQRAECCVFLTPVETCETWSIQPEEGARIDDDGVFTVDPDTPPGTQYLVIAHLGGAASRRITSGVTVYTPASNPLRGLYTEDVQYACETGDELLPDVAIGELDFRADGTFGVTWTPFEVYVDYWGDYAFDLETGELQLFVSGGNYIPDDIDGSGRFSFDAQGRLLLTDIWLGNPRGSSAAPRCGHRFD